MNKYKQLKDHLQKQYDALPIKYAFSEMQFKNILKEFETEAGGRVRLLHIGHGAYIQAQDEKLIDDFLESSDRELAEAMKDDDFLYDAFNYELANHEFCYTDDVSDALAALGLSWEQIKDDKRIMRILKKACEYQYDNAI